MNRPDLIKHPQLSINSLDPHLRLLYTFHRTHQPLGPEFLSDKVSWITTTLLALQSRDKSREVAAVLFALDPLGHESGTSGDIVGRFMVFNSGGESGISGGQDLEDERWTRKGGRLKLGLCLVISE
jgi:hypothetical protein